jgi:hypothetical protein
MQGKHKAVTVLNDATNHEVTWRSGDIAPLVLKLKKGWRGPRDGVHVERGGGGGKDSFLCGKSNPDSLAGNPVFSSPFPESEI